mgnify:CR=1 FL=1
MKKLICFDMDNTLVYSDKAHIISYNEALAKLGFKKKSKEFLKKLFGMPHLKIAKIILPKSNKNILNKFLEIHDKILLKKTYKYIKAVSGVRKVLTKLNKNYDLALLSNCSHETMLATLKGAKINKKYFRISIGNDDVKYSKPYPDEILKAEKLEHNKADFIVGDSIYDIIAGKKAKVKTIAVLTGNYSKVRLKKYKPDYILKSIRELPNLLNEINSE